MGKMYKQRVKVGVQEDMTPIYKWACGHSIDEMNDCIVRLYVEHAHQAARPIDAQQCSHLQGIR